MFIKAKKNNSKFLSVLSGTEITTLKLPLDVDENFLELILFRKDLELICSKPRIALDEVDVQKQINEKGYAIHAAKVESEIIP